MWLHSCRWLILRQCLLQFFDDLQHAIAAHDGVIHQEPQRGRVFQDDRRDQPLDALAVPLQQAKPRFLLVRGAQDADEDDGGMQIAGHIHVVDRDQARLAARGIRGG